MIRRMIDDVVGYSSEMYKGGLSRGKDIYPLRTVLRARKIKTVDCVHNFPVRITVAKYEVHSRVQIALSHAVYSV